MKTLHPHIIAQSFTKIKFPITNPGTGKKSILWDVDYDFEYRKRGWQEISMFTEPTSGLQPSDVDNPAAGIAAGKTAGNGWTQCATLRPVDFNELGLPDLRYF